MSERREFSEMVFEDQFIGNDMLPEWRWEDRQNGGSWDANQGYLEMQANTGQNLWHGPDGKNGDMSAPRLLMETTDDFAIETRMHISPQLREHGGLLIWKNENQFLRFEKTSGPQIFRCNTRFERHVHRQFHLMGLGKIWKGRDLSLRIERCGNQFSAFSSHDGIHWKAVGDARVAMGPRVQVGLHAFCPDNLPSTLTKFNYFRVFKTKN